MQNLRAGDVITNLNCPVHRNHRILVLANRGGTWFDFSVMTTGALSIVRDTKGPWRWNDQAETFVNRDGDEYGHVGPETIVQERAGSEQLQWYPRAADARGRPLAHRSERSDRYRRRFGHDREDVRASGPSG
jgi:hypothetical protein